MECVDDGTSWLKVSYDGEELPWYLKSIENCGMAAFANKHFATGDLICTEMPTIAVSGWHPFNSDQILELTEKISSLNDEDRIAFNNLSNVFPEIKPPAAGIFMTNSFDMVDCPLGRYSGMYCAIARLNHSCIPNAQQTHYPDTTEEVVYATRDIDIHSEINDSYIDLRQSRSARRDELLKLFRFECNCSACSMNDEDVIADDKRRKRALQLEENIITAAETDPLNALDIAFELLKLLEDPLTIGWSERYLASAHLTIFQLAESLTKKSLMKTHLLKAHEYHVRYQGTNSPDSKHTLQLIQKYRKKLKI